MKPAGNVLKVNLERHICLLLVSFVVAMVILLAGTAWVCAFDVDEFQHTQMAWLISTGAIPYHDFFEHHTPLYHFLIAPLLASPLLLTDADAAIHRILELRILDVGLCGIILALTCALTNRLAGRLAALFASALLVSSVVFIQKGVEIRPDQLATILLLISTLALVWAAEARQWQWLCALSGIAAALAVMTTQKILMAGPGLAVTFFVLMAQKRLPARDIILGCMIYAVAGILALLPLLGWFHGRGALGEFFLDNFLLGSKWPHEQSTIPWIFSLMFREDPIFLLLACAGLFECLKQKRAVCVRDLAIFAPFISMLLFVPLFPVVQRQYIFLFLPYMAVLAGIGGAFITRAIASPHSWYKNMAMLLPVIVALHGVSLIGHQLSERNDDTLQIIRYTVGKTLPTDTVMNSWTTGIVFRKPAFYYGILNPEIRYMVPQDDFDKLLAGLRSGKVAPTLITMDKDMEQLPPPIVEILKRGWKPTGVASLWRRR